MKYSTVLIVTALVFLAPASPADAKYLHLSDGKAGAQRYIDLYSQREANHGVKFGTCWRAGPHVVQCGFTQDEGYSGPEHDVAVIALRGRLLYGHALLLRADGSLYSQPRTRLFIRRL